MGSTVLDWGLVESHIDQGAEFTTPCHWQTPDHAIEQTPRGGIEGWRNKY
jgi:hypothetical protein